MHYQIAILPHTFTELARKTVSKTHEKYKCTRAYLEFKHLVLANDVRKNCEIFIQIALHNGTSKKSNVKRRLRHYKKQKTKNSISLPPDTLSYKQAICRANYQSYYWQHCTDKIFSHLLLTSNGWNYNKQLSMVVPVWLMDHNSLLQLSRKK